MAKTRRKLHFTQKSSDNSRRCVLKIKHVLKIEQKNLRKKCDKKQDEISMVSINVLFIIKVWFIEFVILNIFNFHHEKLINITLQYHIKIIKYKNKFEWH